MMIRAFALCDKLSSGRLALLREDRRNAIYHRILDLNASLLEKRRDQLFDPGLFLQENHCRTLAVDVSVESSDYIFRFLPGISRHPVDFISISSAEKGISADGYLFWGIPKTLRSLFAVRMAPKPVLFVEGGLLASIGVPCDSNLPMEYRCITSFLADDISIYYNGGFPSRLELLLESDLEITEEQKKRARQLIDRIIANKLSKYNHQPMEMPRPLVTRRPRVLVVDQRYGDQSIAFGCADDNTFERMLRAAIEENPGADIWVKTHPHSKVDRASCFRTAYFDHLQPHDRVIPIRESINPQTLIQEADKVYVVTSQVGYEALLCGKEVHVFGYPFFAGWGLTRDRIHSHRRTKKRSLEELFYIVNILYARYVHPETSRACEMEEIVDYLLKMRERYFASGDRNRRRVA